MVKPHPLISVYGDTENRDFDLILIFGREPNNNIPMSNSVGRYDFIDAPKCAFWNMAFKLMGEECKKKLTVREIKDEFKNAESCPICFADCSPKPIPSQNNNKTEERRKISTMEFQNHINEIFSKDIIKRVKLVLISVERKELSESVKLIVDLCNRKKIEYNKIPFLYNQNYPRIEKEVDEKTKSKINEIYGGWDNSTN